MGRIVELPPEVHWGHPDRPFDLGDPDDLRFVYQVVLREGDERHLRRFIDVGVLLEVWDDLFLPVGVETAWADYFRIVHGVEVRRRWASPTSSAG